MIPHPTAVPALCQRRHVGRVPRFSYFAAAPDCFIDNCFVDRSVGLSTNRNLTVF